MGEAKDGLARAAESSSSDSEEEGAPLRKKKTETVDKPNEEVCFEVLIIQEQCSSTF